MIIKKITDFFWNGSLVNQDACSFVMDNLILATAIFIIFPFVSYVRFGNPLSLSGTMIVWLALLIMRLVKRW